jgi:Family of unknown function (DUF5316)
MGVPIIKRPFITGVVFLVVVLIVSMVLGDGSLILKISGGVGLIGMLASGLLTGAFISGDRIRANYYTESKEDRSKRIRTANSLFLFGLPNFAASVVYFFAIFN